MALGVFNAKFTIMSSTFITDHYRVEAYILDQAGYFSGYDVQVGDIVHIDISNSPVDNTMVARYRVINVVSQDAYTVTVDMIFLDSGSIPDPNDYISQPGIIVRVSSNMGMGWVSSSTLQLVPKYFERYASNIDIYDQLDNVVFSGTTGIQGLTGLHGLTGADGISGETGPPGVTGMLATGRITGLTTGYIPVAVTGMISLLDSFISQGYIDTTGTNTPIISYNSTHFVTVPTGLISHTLYQQYSSKLINGIMDVYGTPVCSFEFDGILADDFSGMTLTSDGHDSTRAFYNSGLLYIASLAGSYGDFVSTDTNRSFSITDLYGPGYKTQFVLGGGFTAESDFVVSFSGQDLGPRFTLYHFSDSDNELDGGIFNFGRLYQDGWDLTTTIDGNKLGTFRFRSTPIDITGNAWSRYDARIRAVQNGDAVTDGVPVDVFIEASNGAAWNINQLVVSNNNKIDIGKVPSLAKLDINGDVAISTISARSTPATIFLTMETGIIRFRTAAQVLSDISAGATGTSFYTGAVDFPYSPATGAYWINPVPTTVQQALDRIAQAIYLGATRPIGL